MKRISSRSIVAASAVTLALAVGLSAQQQQGQSQTPAAPPAQTQGQDQTPGRQGPPGPGQGRTGGGGQMPAPKNLQVLPKDWTAQQVSQFMRTYVVPGLGVQCGFCHVQDRSSDEKPEKVEARKMIAMMMAINGDFLKDVGMPAPDGMKVTCYTCHRGDKMPLTKAPAPPNGGGGR